MRALCSVVVLVSVLVQASVVRATECAPTIASQPALAAIDAETRLAFLQKRINAAARASKIWTGSWIGIYSLLTVGSVALIPVVTKEKRVDYYFSGATSLVGLISLGLGPLKSIPDARWFAKRAPTESICAAVADGERLLMRDALSEEEAQKTLLHVGNIVINFGALLGLGFGYHRWGSAALQGLAGTAIGEAMIISTPLIAAHSLDAYRRGELNGPIKAPPVVSLAAAPMIMHEGAGLMIGGRW